jgi:NADPH:quinone reductase-like Zn-dependent oxidoreductase
MMRQSCCRVTPHHPLESIACQNMIEGILVKAVRTHGRGGPEQIFFEDAPLPEVRRGDVLVQVRATGITPAELTWDETYQNADGAPRIPSIPGHEVSGMVERMAADVTDFRIGDEVYGLADFPRDCAAAEFASVRAINLALKPRGITIGGETRRRSWRVLRTGVAYFSS